MPEPLERFFVRVEARGVGPGALERLDRAQRDVLVRDGGSERAARLDLALDVPALVRRALEPAPGVVELGARARGGLAAGLHRLERVAVRRLELESQQRGLRGDRGERRGVPGGVHQPGDDAAEALQHARERVQLGGRRRHDGTEARSGLGAAEGKRGGAGGERRCLERA